MFFEWEGTEFKCSSHWVSVSPTETRHSTFLLGNKTWRMAMDITAQKNWLQKSDCFNTSPHCDTLYVAEPFQGNIQQDISDNEVHTRTPTCRSRSRTIYLIFHFQIFFNKLICHFIMSPLNTIFKSLLHYVTPLISHSFIMSWLWYTQKSKW